MQKLYHEFASVTNVWLTHITDRNSWRLGRLNRFFGLSCFGPNRDGLRTVRPKAQASSNGRTAVGTRENSKEVLDTAEGYTCRPKTSADCTADSGQTASGTGSVKRLAPVKDRTARWNTSATGWTAGHTAVVREAGRMARDTRATGWTVVHTVVVGLCGQETTWVWNGTESNDEQTYTGNRNPTQKPSSTVTCHMLCVVCIVLRDGIIKR